PCRLFLQSAQAERAGPHSPDLLRVDEPRLLQDADVLLHAGEGHAELLGKVRDRSVCTRELLQNAASGGVRERGERGIEAGPGILNHVVQYLPHRLAGCKGRPRAAAFAGPIDLISMEIGSTRRSPRPGDRQVVVELPDARFAARTASRFNLAGHSVKDLTRASTSERASVPSSRWGLKMVTSIPTALGLPSAVRRMASSSSHERPSGNR